MNAELITLKLTGMTHGGEALGRDETGRVVFVPYAIPGEEVRVEIVERKKEFARARLVELISSSPSRVIPRCPHFGPRGGFPLPSSPTRPAAPSPRAERAGEGEKEEGRRPGAPEPPPEMPPADEFRGLPPAEQEGGGGEVTNQEAMRTSLWEGKGERPARGCGGCQWQHIDYQAQLEFKRQILRDQFARIGKMPDAPVAAARGGREWNYRNHMRFALNEEGRLSLQALESHTLVPIRECHIMDAPLVALFSTLELEGADFEAVQLRAGENTGDRLIIFEATEAEPPAIETDEPVSIAFQVADATVTLVGKEAIEERIGARTYRISPRSFFQVNSPMAEVLLTLVEQFLAPRPDETLLDAYGGVGLFGLSLAGRVARVIEIEASQDAIEDARYNARDMTNVELHQGVVERVLPVLNLKPDLAVVDPPRAGMERAALDALAAGAPRVIAYVSCDAATLARDARRIVDAGYRVTDIQPVDLFPQTFHIECVTRFEKR